MRPTSSGKLLTIAMVLVVVASGGAMAVGAGIAGQQTDQAGNETSDDENQTSDAEIVAENVSAERLELSGLTVSNLTVELGEYDGTHAAVEGYFQSNVGDVEGLEVGSVRVESIENGTVTIEDGVATIDAEIGSVVLTDVQAERVTINQSLDSLLGMDELGIDRATVSGLSIDLLTFGVAGDEEPTDTPTETPTEEPTEEPTDTPTEEPTETETPTETDTPTEEPTETETPTETDTPTEEPTETETPTEEPTETETETPTEEPTETETPTETDTPTEEPTETATPTETPNETETPTDTPTETETPNETATPDNGGAAPPAETETPAEEPTETETPNETETLDDGAAVPPAGEDGATVTFVDQNTSNETVIVERANLSNGGFVAIHNASLLENESVDSVIGVSDYLEPGVHENVTVDLFEVPGTNVTNESLTEALIAMPHVDSNNNTEYEFVFSGGEADGAYLADGEAVVDLANVTAATNADA